MKNSEPLTPGEARERCRTYAFRLEDSILKRGRDLLTIWDSSNTPDNPLRHLPGPDGKAVAINLMMSACLHEVILIVCAVLDGRKENRPLKTSNLVSFPIVAELIQQAGNEAVELDVDQEEIAVLARQRFLKRVADLTAAPNAERLRRLRAFRDDHLAHALDQQELRTPPMLNDIHSLMDEACILSADCQLALFGRRVTWREDRVTVKQSIDAIWRIIARAST